MRTRERLRHLRARFRALPLLARLLLWLLAAGSTLALLSVLWVAAVLSGGLDNLLDLHHPTETSREVVEARRSAVPALERDVTALAAELAAATGMQVVDATWSRDECRTGQHNWKIDDPYDLLCTAERAALLTGPAPQAQAQLAALVAHLEQAGYTTGGGGEALELGLLGADGLVHDNQTGRGGRYHLTQDGRRVELRLTPLTVSTPSYRLPSAPGTTFVLDGAEADASWVTPARLLGAGRYGVALEVSVEYFVD